MDGSTHHFLIFLAYLLPYFIWQASQNAARLGFSNVTALTSRTVALLTKSTNYPSFGSSATGAGAASVAAGAGGAAGGATC